MADDLAEVLADFAALPAYSRVLEASQVVILQMQILDTQEMVSFKKHMLRSCTLMVSKGCPTTSDAAPANVPAVRSCRHTDVDFMWRTKRQDVGCLRAERNSPLQQTLPSLHAATAPTTVYVPYIQHRSRVLRGALHT